MFIIILIIIVIQVYDREVEFRVLEDAYKSNKAEMVIIYGRRRMGKTTLVQEFLNKVGGVYLFTPRANIDMILEMFSKDLSEQLGEFIRFRDWKDFLEFLVFKSKKERFVIAIDEFQRISKADEPAISMLQHYWDNYLSKTKIVLILIGSLVGMVEKLALTGDAPLCGRKTRELKLSQIPYIVLRDYWKNYDEEQRVEIYGFFGGTPAYFSLTSDEMSPIENVAKLVLEPGAKLAREPEELLSEELRAPHTYMSILGQIARLKVGAPLSKIKVRKGSPTSYLYTLMKMDIIEPLESLAQGSKIYTIKDDFFRFWFKFIYPRQTLLELKRGLLLVNKIERSKDEFLAFTFEKILREFIVFASGFEIKGVEIPCIHKIGAFWKKDVEIDACALANDTVICGEAKWEKRKVDRAEVEKLIAKTDFAKKELRVKESIGIILSRSGFTNSARALEGKNLILLDLEDFAAEAKKIKKHISSLHL